MQAFIHMNGRIYDPKLGRMLSPDPITEAPENGQNYNRYSYVFNNPLKYTDPSGYRRDKGKWAAIGGTADFRQSEALQAAAGNYVTGGAFEGDISYQVATDQTKAWAEENQYLFLPDGNAATLGMAGNGSAIPTGKFGDISDNQGNPVSSVTPAGERQLTLGDAGFRINVGQGAASVAILGLETMSVAACAITKGGACTRTAAIVAGVAAAIALNTLADAVTGVDGFSALLVASGVDAELAPLIISAVSFSTGLQGPSTRLLNSILSRPGGKIGDQLQNHIDLLGLTANSVAEAQGNKQ